MVANISPASSQYDETCNTLKYASRAIAIKTQAQQAQIVDTAAYTEALQQLQGSSNPAPNPLTMTKESFFSTSAKDLTAQSRLNTQQGNHGVIKFAAKIKHPAAGTIACIAHLFFRSFRNFRGEEAIGRCLLGAA